MHTYTHKCTHACAHTKARTHAHAHVLAHIHIHIHIHTHKHMYTHIHTHTLTRAHRKYGARAHPAICAARDQYGGLCLVVAHSPASSSRHRQVNDAQNDRHPESRLRKSRRKQGRRAGIAADEELLAIPR